MVVASEDQMTPARLQVALNEMHAHNVPDWASLQISQSQSGRRWTVVAKWDPTAPTLEAPLARSVDDVANPPEVHVEVHPGGRISDADVLRLAQRRIRDNPQA